MTNTLTDLFKTYRDLDKPPILILQNRNHVPVAAIYLNQTSWKDLIVSEELDFLNNPDKERYFLAVGKPTELGIFFTYFQKINQ